MGYTSGFTAATACPRWGHNNPELSLVATADAKLIVATADAGRVVVMADAKNASTLTPNASVIGIN